MKRKGRSKQDIAKKEMVKYLEYLTRRELFVEALRYGSTAMSMPALMRLMFKETSAYAETGLTVGAGVMQVHYGGGPGADNHALPVAQWGIGGNITELPPSALNEYGVDMAADRSIAQGVIVNVFGNRFYNPSGVGTATRTFLDGVLQGSNADPAGGTFLQQADIDKVLAFNVAVRSQDDNNTNPCGLNNIVHNVNSILPGRFNAASLMESIGLNNTETGMGNSPFSADRTTPFIPTAGQDIGNQFNFAANIPFTTAEDKKKIEHMATALKGMSDGHVDGRELATATAAFKASAKEAHQSNLNYINNAPPKMDPKVPGDDPSGLTQQIANIFGITANTGNNDATYRFAAGLAHVVKPPTAGQRNVHFVGTTLNGRDYHQNSTTTTRGLDLENGILVNRCIRTALAAQQNLFIITTKDGSVSMDRNPAAAIVALGDRGNLGCFTVFFVNGNPAIPVTLLRGQIGRVNNDGNADVNTLSGRNDMAAAVAVAATVLHVMGMPDEDIMTVFPVFNTKEKLLEYRALQRA